MSEEKDLIEELNSLSAEPEEKPEKEQQKKPAVQPKTKARAFLSSTNKEVLLWRLQEIECSDPKLQTLLHDTYTYIAESIAPNEALTRRIAFALSSGFTGFPKSLLTDIQTYLGGDIIVEDAQQPKEKKKFFSKKLVALISSAVAILIIVLVLL